MTVSSLYLIMILMIVRLFQVISNKLSTDLHSCNEWLIDNKLSLHVGKTECILFGSKRKLGKIQKIEINYNGHTITGQTMVKYLGVRLDQSLTGEAMVTQVVSKVAGKLKFLYRYQHCLNRNLRKNLSSALLQCHIDYCCTTWFSGLSCKWKNKLQVTQNKIVRFIHGMQPRSHIGQVELKRGAPQPYLSAR